MTSGAFFLAPRLPPEGQAKRPSAPLSWFRGDEQCGAAAPGLSFSPFSLTGASAGQSDPWRGCSGLGGALLEPHNSA